MTLTEKDHQLLRWYLLHGEDEVPVDGIWVQNEEIRLIVHSYLRPAKHDGVHLAISNYGLDRVKAILEYYDDH